MSHARPVVVTALLGLLAAWSLAAGAQQIYRIVGPDGRITFSDRPPPADSGVTATRAPVVTMPSTAAEANAALPFELRAAAGRYPVTLYARAGCAPCDAGRNYLTSRGIPFAEKTVTSQEDIEALQRLMGTPTLPLITIGGQQLKGYSEAEWGQFLDAAGYPKTSLLPPTYRRPPAEPLVAATQPVQPGSERAGQQAPQRAAAPAPATPAPSNPAGIQF